MKRKTTNPLVVSHLHISAHSHTQTSPQVHILVHVPADATEWGYKVVGEGGSGVRCDEESQRWRDKPPGVFLIICKDQQCSRMHKGWDLTARSTGQEGLIVSVTSIHTHLLFMRPSARAYSTQTQRCACVQSNWNSQVSPAIHYYWIGSSDCLRHCFLFSLKV